VRCALCEIAIKKERLQFDHSQYIQQFVYVHVHDVSRLHVHIHIHVHPLRICKIGLGANPRRGARGAAPRRVAAAPRAACAPRRAVRPAAPCMHQKNWIFACIENDFFQRCTGISVTVSISKQISVHCTGICIGSPTSPYPYNIIIGFVLAFSQLCNGICTGFLLALQRFFQRCTGTLEFSASALHWNFACAGAALQNSCSRTHSPLLFSPLPQSTLPISCIQYIYIRIDRIRIGVVLNRLPFRKK